MSHHKKRGTTPVPPGNQPHAGPAVDDKQARQGAVGSGGSPFQDHDAKRRIGDFESAGEHSRQQPSAINDGQQHSR
jgi:hypothetical protein